ncbi:MAG TPA: tetratricopeptide repeat protein [Gemmatimonadales bacterium]|nr:tetratricopeptide repeat protein [Gemmatimonadales bacterium]
MSDPFLSSDEYDERAHQLYNEGRYDEAVDVLKEGLAVYPDALELHVGLGYARLAREEYAWSRQSFEASLKLDPDHEDALAGLGEVLLKIGERDAGVKCFDRVMELGFKDDLDIVLQMGRALFREGMVEGARRFFELALLSHPASAEAAACVGYAAHRLAAESDALRWLRHALELDPGHMEARIYLANLLYDRGEYEPSLAEFERTQPDDHWDELGIWRLIELKRSVYRLPEDDPELKPWLVRLADLAGDADATDLLLAEIEAAGPDGTGSRDPAQLELFGTLVTELQAMHRQKRGFEVHRVTTSDGVTYVGTWEDIVAGMRDDDQAYTGRPIEEFLAGAAARATRLTGVSVPATDAEAFLRGYADAGLVKILR